MSLIAEQRVDDNGLYMRDSGGREFAITAAEMKALYLANLSSKDGAVSALKSLIASSLGRSVDTTKTFFDFEPSSGKILEATIGSPTTGKEVPK